MVDPDEAQHDRVGDHRHGDPHPGAAVDRLSAEHGTQAADRGEEPVITSACGDRQHEHDEHVGDGRERATRLDRTAEHEPDELADAEVDREVAGRHEDRCRPVPDHPAGRGSIAPFP